MRDSREPACDGLLQNLKELARAGQGLNAFINAAVKYKYLRRAD